MSEVRAQVAELNESEMLALLSEAKNVLLIEPTYKRKYPPLGLAKIATYVKEHDGCISFRRNYDGLEYDLICVTSLFTYDAPHVLKAIRGIRVLNKTIPVLVGGVYASLMSKDVLSRHTDVLLFRNFSKELDQCVPDYSVDWHLESPWDEFSFLFTTRGCPNRCAYCSVWRIEPNVWVNPSWRTHILDDKPNVMISDNNLTAAPEKHFNELLSFLEKTKKHVVFDNGFDVKFITSEMGRRLGSLRFTRAGMRVAFDRIEEDGIFQRAVESLKVGGVSAGNIMAYVLFNFNDTPRDADYRMRECVKLGIRPYPQQFVPLNKGTKDKMFVGKYWSLRLTRAFRNFWLMAGLHKKMSFDEYLSTPQGKKVLGIDPKGQDAWKHSKSFRK